jgi:hypothetical protein
LAVAAPFLKPFQRLRRDFGKCIRAQYQQRRLLLRRSRFWVSARSGLKAIEEGQTRENAGVANLVQASTDVLWRKNTGPVFREDRTTVLRKKLW